jgi:hypothetical protein
MQLSTVLLTNGHRPAHLMQEQPRASASSSGNGSTPSSGGSAAPRSTQNGSGSSGSHGGELAGGRKHGSRKQQITARLLVDCMGHYSPVVKQMRGGSKPEAMVLVLGGCADGVPAELNRWATPVMHSS